MKVLGNTKDHPKLQELIQKAMVDADFFESETQKLQGKLQELEVKYEEKVAFVQKSIEKKAVPLRKKYVQLMKDGQAKQAELEKNYVATLISAGLLPAEGKAPNEAIIFTDDGEIQIKTVEELMKEAGMEDMEAVNVGEPELTTTPS